LWPVSIDTFLIFCITNRAGWPEVRWHNHIKAAQTVLGDSIAIETIVIAGLCGSVLGDLVLRVHSEEQVWQHDPWADIVTCYSLRQIYERWIMAKKTNTVHRKLDIRNALYKLMFVVMSLKAGFLQKGLLLIAEIAYGIFKLNNVSTAYTSLNPESYKQKLWF